MVHASIRLPGRVPIRLDRPSSVSPTEGVLHGQARAFLRRHQAIADVVGLDETGADGFDDDAGVAQFLGELDGQLVERRFRGIVADITLREIRRRRA